MIAQGMAQEDAAREIQKPVAGDRGYRLVQMNLREATIARAGELQEMLGASNRTDAIKTAIEIAYLVVSTVLKGGRVVLFDAKENGREVLIPGLAVR